MKTISWPYESQAVDKPELAGQSATPVWLVRAQHLGVFLGFLIASIAMTWPLATGLWRNLVSWGDPVFQSWTMAWVVHSLSTDPLGVFDANIFYPYRNTLAYSDHLLGQAALVAPVLLATGNVILADNISVLLALALSGFAMYWLVYDLTGSRLAGVVAGFAYAFAPARMAHLEHLHILSAQWMPLALLAARRVLLGDSTRWVIALGGFVLLQGLFGIYFLYFLLVMLGVVFVSYLVWRPTQESLAALAKAVAACGVAVMLLLPTLFPYLQVHNDLGIERTKDEVMMWSAIGSDYLAVSPQNRLYGEVLGERYSEDLERDLFPGLVLLSLAVTGLFAHRLGWERATLLVLVVLSVILSFGLVWELNGREIPLPYQLPYDLIPGFRSIRVPARFGLLALVGLAALAGLGADMLLRKVRALDLPTGSRNLFSVALAGVLIAGIAAEYSTRVVVADPLPVNLEEAQRPDYAWMAENPAPAIEFPMGEGLVASSWPNYWSTMHWNPVVNGFSGFTPPVYYEFRERMRQFPSDETISLLQGIGVETIVYHADTDTPADQDAFLQGVAQFPQLRQVVGGPDYVYQLEPDPWAWRLAEALPDNAEVDLSPITDPVEFGLLAAVLQRHDHTVYWGRALDYWQVPAAPEGVCFVVASGSDPVIPDGDTVESAGPLVLIRKAACGSGG